MSYTPEIKVPDNFSEVNVWASISANDKDGITIDGIKKDDQVTITSASGICSFDKSDFSALGSIVAITTGLLQDGTRLKIGDAAENTLKAVQQESKKLQKSLEQEIKHKRRDAFGQDPKSGDYAKNEGGIIVCMPKAGGVIYATSDNRLKGGAKKDGRLEKYCSEEIKNHNSFFLCRKKGGKMSAKVKKDGNVHMLAFDQKFKDNAGIYIVDIKIER